MSGRSGPFWDGVEGRALTDPGGAVIATATATAQVIALNRAPGAA